LIVGRESLHTTLAAAKKQCQPLVIASARLPAAAAAAAHAASQTAAVEVCSVSSGVASTTYKANWVDQIQFQWLQVYISLGTDGRPVPAIILSRPR